jgi:hypothetical protein
LTLTPTGEPLSPRSWRKVGLVILALGLAVQLWLWNRGRLLIGSSDQLPPARGDAVPCLVLKYDHPQWLADQVDLLAPGLVLVARGELLPVSKTTSGGGLLPGPVLQSLVGLPLALWFDYRAASAVIGLFHLVAGVLVWRAVAGVAGERLAAWCLALFWLSPWRLYHSAHVWEPGYVLLPAAAHLWACERLRTTARIWPSFLLGLIVTLGVQLHLSIAILAALSGVLVWQRRIHVRPASAVAGAVLGLVPALPALAAWLGGRPPLAGVPASLEGLGLFERLYQLGRGQLYWIRFGSPEIGRRLRQTSFWPDSPAYETVQQALEGWLIVALSAACVACVAVTTVAWWSMLRRRTSSDGDRGFLFGYARITWFVMLLAAFFSPVTPQGWHLLVVLPAACLPVAAWVESAFASPQPWWRRSAASALVVLPIPVIVLIGLGHPIYRPATPGTCVPFEDLPSHWFEAAGS